MDVERWLIVVIFAVIFFLGLPLILVAEKMHDSLTSRVLFRIGAVGVLVGFWGTIGSALHRGLLTNDLPLGKHGCMYQSQCQSGVCVKDVCMASEYAETH